MARKTAAPESDVTIIGAGIAGLTLAALLARAALRVTIVETQPARPAATEDGYDQRCIAIIPACARVLQNCGAWTGIVHSRHGVFRRMEVWDERSSGRIRFDSASLAEPALGHIVEQRILCAALEAALREQANVSWKRPASLSAWSVQEDRLTVTLAEGLRFGTRLLVGAEGADSRVRLLAGIGYTRHDYDQEALVCNVRTEHVHADTARQRFLHTGPLAFLPLDDAHQCSIVWSTSPREARRLLALDAAAFCAALTQAFEHALGRVTDTGPRAAFPLLKARAERYVQPRIALIGDAAHSIHPLAGQGANLGVLDAAALAQVVNEAAADENDIGSLRTLRRYERWRKGENRLMQSVMDGFKYLFGSNQPALRWLRGTGLNLTDRCTPVKELILRHAMGLAGDLPSAARSTGA